MRNKILIIPIMLLITFSGCIFYPKGKAGYYYEMANSYQQAGEPTKARECLEIASCYEGGYGNKARNDLSSRYGINYSGANALKDGPSADIIIGGNSGVMMTESAARVEDRSFNERMYGKASMSNNKHTEKELKNDKKLLEENLELYRNIVKVTVNVTPQLIYLGTSSVLEIEVKIETSKIIYADAIKKYSKLWVYIESETNIREKLTNFNISKTEFDQQVTFTKEIYLKDTAPGKYLVYAGIDVFKSNKVEIEIH